MGMMPSEPFEIRLPDAVLADLQRRLEHVRLPRDFANDDWSYGTNGAYMEQLVAYWRDGYDWRARERAMNTLHHRRVEIDGVPIHFVHERGRGPDPVPIVLSHGWPWTFWDYRKIIGPLTDPASHGGDAADSFDVIVPSLPGFGFSTPLTRTGVNAWTTADLWATLMTDVLGYDRFGAAGGDWGALTTAQLGHKYADRLVGIYLTHIGATLDLYGNDRPWDPFSDAVAPLAGSERAEFIDWERRFASHVCVHVLDPETLAYAMHDSPVGMAAWLVERRRAWSDCGGDVERRFSKDELLDNVMLYWATEAFVTSVRFYAEAARYTWTPSHDRTPVVEAPTGYTIFLPDAIALPRDWIPGYFNICFANERSAGGHFAPAEEPDAVIDDIRATFRPLR
jgi:pimeloyl-ACP methyl ester carboxylesterase